MTSIKALKQPFCNVTMLADDTTVIEAGKRVDNLIRKDVDYMLNWFCFNKLAVNINKCESICFGKGKPEKIEINGQQIEYKNGCKYLGKYIDKNLKFREHIYYVVKKTQYILWNILSCSSSLYEKLFTLVLQFVC